MSGSVRHDEITDVIADYTLLLAEAAGIFHELVVSPPPERAEVSEALGALAHEADQKCVELSGQIARSFQATAEREDLSALVSCLDDAIDALADAGTLLLAFGTATLSADFVTQVVELEHKAREVSREVDALATPKRTGWFGQQVRGRVWTKAGRASRHHTGDHEQAPGALDAAQVAVLRRSVQAASRKVDQVVRSLDAVTAG